MTLWNVLLKVSKIDLMFSQKIEEIFLKAKHDKHNMLKQGASNNNNNNKTRAKQRTFCLNKTTTLSLYRLAVYLTEK